MKNSQVVGIIIIIVLILSIAFAVYYFRQERSVPVDDMVGWKTYENVEHGFEFRYPPTLSVSVSEQKGQLQIDMVETDTDTASFDYVLGIFVDEFTSSFEELAQTEFGPDEQRRVAETTVAGIRAVRIALCESGMPYEPPCVIPQTEQEVLEKGTMVRFSNNNRTYSIQLPWYSTDIELLNNVISTFNFIE